MNTQSKRVLFIGDIVGRTGRRAVKKVLPTLKKKYSPHLVIANGENLAGGYGLTEKTTEEMFQTGIDLFTTGNHIWDKKESIGYIEKQDRILRPLNYPPGVP
ncbi:MAG: metallophosphoesterase, partial [Nitrospirae bacterium]